MIDLLLDSYSERKLFRKRETGPAIAKPYLMRILLPCDFWPIFIFVPKYY